MKEKNDLTMLVVSAGSGKQKAITELYDKTKNYAYSVARQYLPQDDIADAVQEAYIAVFRHLGTFDATKEFLPWLHSIVRNKCIDMLKKNQPRLFAEADELDEMQDEGMLPADITEREEKRKAILNIISGLSVGQKTVVTLFYLEGFSISEIADELEISEGSVKKQLHLARQAIKKAVLEEESERGNKLYGAGGAVLAKLLRSEVQSGAHTMPEAMAAQVLEGITAEVAVTATAAATTTGGLLGGARWGKVAIGIAVAAVVTVAAVYTLGQPGGKQPPPPQSSAVQADAGTLSEEPTAEELAQAEKYMQEGKEAEAFLLKLDEIRFGRSLYYSDVMDMDLDGTNELLTLYSDLEEESVREIAIWRYEDGEVIKVQGSLIGMDPVGSQAIWLLTEGGKHLLAAHGGKLRNGNETETQVFVSAQQTETFHTLYRYHEAFPGLLTEDDEHFYIDDIEVSEQEYSDRYAPYAAFEEKKLLLDGGGAWQEYEYEELLERYKQTEAKLISLITRGSTANLALQYPEAAISPEQRELHAQMVNMMSFADLQDLGLYEKGNARDYGDGILGALLAGCYEPEDIWQGEYGERRASKADADAFTQKVFGIQNAEDIFGEPSGGYYHDTADAGAAEVGYFLPQIYDAMAFRVSEHMVLIAGTGVVYGWDEIWEVYPIYTLMHIDGEDMQIHAYNKGGMIPQGLIESLAENCC